MVNIGVNTTTALVAYQVSASQSVQAIMKHVVAYISCDKYMNENITLLLWLFNNEVLQK